MFDFHPYTVLLTVFIILVIKNSVNHVGKSKIQNFGWDLYRRVGSKYGFKQFVAYNNKKKELNDVNREKKSISAQDQYAKWTKLNRQSDKLAAEIKTLEEDITKSKSSIDRLTGLVIMVLTTAPIWIFRILFRKTVLFYLPNKVFPSYVEWVLALPFIQIGGIGLTVWMFASNNVISTVLFLVSFPFETKPAKPVKPVKVEETKETSEKIASTN